MPTDFCRGTVLRRPRPHLTSPERSEQPASRCHHHTPTVAATQRCRGPARKRESCCTTQPNNPARIAPFMRSGIVLRVILISKIRVLQPALRASDASFHGNPPRTRVSTTGGDRSAAEGRSIPRSGGTPTANGDPDADRPGAPSGQVRPWAVGEPLPRDRPGASREAIPPPAAPAHP